MAEGGAVTVSAGWRYSVLRMSGHARDGNGRAKAAARPGLPHLGHPRTMKAQRRARHFELQIRDHV